MDRFESAVSEEIRVVVAQLVETLALSGPLAVLDLEATGLELETDRIIEVCVVRFGGMGAPRQFTSRVDPECAVPPEATAVHGIHDEDLVGAPTFRDLAPDLERFLDGADLAGYNHGRYDLPLLEAEFRRAGVVWDWRSRRLLDVSSIFRRMEPRSLAGALRFYCAAELEDAHTAAADVAATIRVLAGQFERYPTLSRELDELDAFTRPPELPDSD